MLSKLKFAAAAVALCTMSGAAHAQQTFITIGTGGVTGVYYPTGGAICRLVNKDRKEHGIRCSVESTGGSVYNTRTIRAGELDFGVVQSDVQSAAIEGVRAFENDDPYGGLRAVFSVHPEPMHVMVSANSGISSVADMKGKRVNIGNPGSGTRVLANVLMEANGVSPSDFSLAAELKSSEQAAAICDGKIDAAIWAAGLPNGSTMEATSTCDIKILDLSSSNTDKVLESNAAYAAATIPAGMYPGNDDEVKSWGPKATFVTDASTPDEVVHALVKGVFENFEDFKKLHPAFSRLTKEEMVKDGLSAPLHPGAAKYYQEAGLLAAAKPAKQTFITIGTGGVTGVYYPTGGAICRLVNKDRKSHGIRCSVESTGGSVYNTRTIRAGELDFGVVQSDVQSAAMDAERAFENDKPYGNLRSVFSVHPEPMHVMVSAGSGISSVADMKGKRVNIGNPGSGTRVLANVLMEANGVSPSDFSLAAELKSSEQAAAICDGKIDAAIWAAGLPNGSTMEATSTCDIKILDLSSSNTDKVLSSNAAYAAATIPAGMYPGNEDAVKSWGPKATFVTDAGTPDRVVYALVKGVFENFSDFKKLHPAFGRLKKEEMIKDGLSAPLHPGAVKYFKEAGLL